MRMFLTSTAESWWGSIVHKFQSFDKPSDWYMEIGFYALGGLVAGFLIKHFARLVFFSFLLTAIVIILLDYYAIVSINYDYMHMFYGLSSKISLSDIIDLAMNWLGKHIPQTIAACLGFFIAWELV